MTAPLSIVIPTLDAAEALPRTAEALMPGLAAGLIRELVVSDGGSRDGTRAVADALGAEWVAAPPGATWGRGAQIARGVAAARAEWVMILHADTWLGAGWPEAVRAHMAEAPDRAGHFRLRFRASGAAPRLVEGWANLRSRALGLPYGDQGLVLRRAVLEAVGGMPEIPLMEDVALACALRGRLSPLDATALTDAGRYRRRGWLRQGGANLWRLARYLGGADPERLARGYDR